jgi:hypothetical protein
MVRKQRKSVLNDRVEQGMTTPHLKGEKALLIVAGISFLVFVTGSIMHNVMHGQSETEETTFFIIALVAVYVFIAATACALVVFLKARRKSTQDSSVDANV